MKKLWFFLFVFCSLAVSSRLFAQDYSFHPVYIYNFTKYIQWPSEKQTGDFVIGVYGKSPIFEKLKSMATNRTVGAQKIVVKEFASIEDMQNCHIIFIPVGKSSSFPDVSSKVNSKPVLVITEKSGLSKQGSGINFVVIEGKLKYELNKASIDKSGLKVSTDLIKLAILVNS